MSDRQASSSRTRYRDRIARHAPCMLKQPACQQSLLTVMRLASAGKARAGLGRPSWPASFFVDGSVHPLGFLPRHRRHTSYRSCGSVGYASPQKGLSPYCGCAYPPNPPVGDSHAAK
jgi:hypothetical protein